MYSVVRGERLRGREGGGRGGMEEEEGGREGGMEELSCSICLGSLQFVFNLATC